MRIPGERASGAPPRGTRIEKSIQAVLKERYDAAETVEAFIDRAEVSPDLRRAKYRRAKALA